MPNDLPANPVKDKLAQLNFDELVKRSVTNDTTLDSMQLEIDTAQVDITGLTTRVGALEVTAPTRVTSLPGSPVDSQEIFYQSTAMATDSVIWHLRYRSAASGSFKWEFVGGSDWYDFVGTNEGTTNNTYSDLATVGPSITVPLAGDYMISFGCQPSSTVNELPYQTIKIGSAAAADVDGFAMEIRTSAGIAVNTGMRTMRVNGLAASTVLKQMYKTSYTSTTNWGSRWMTVTPIRVG